MSRRTVVGRTRLAAFATFAAYAAFALSPATARAGGDAAGTAVGSFLSIGNGTSVLSMAGATLASGNDLAAASWNVASLAHLDALEFALAHAPLPGGATQDWLAGGGRLGHAGTRWGAQALFHREGDIDGRDAANNPTGTFAVQDIALGASLAQPLGAFVTAGAGIEWVYESYYVTAGSGVSFSTGVRADAGPLGFAIAARHIGGAMHYPNATYDLPAVVAGGVSWTDVAHGLRVNADFEAPSHYYDTARFGGEWLWHERVAFRAGYRLALGAPSDATVSGPTFGIGAGLGTVWMDYSFLLDGGDTGGEHRVGLTFRPGLPARLTAFAPREHSARKPKPVRADAAPVPAPATPAPPSAPQPAPARAATAPATQPPSAAPPASAAPSPPASSMPITRPASVIVMEGETLKSIARRWGTDVTTMMMLNNLVSEQVAVGQRLRIPPASKR